MGSWARVLTPQSCNPEHSTVESEVLWRWYAPSCKFYCIQVTSKDWASPGGNSLGYHLGFGVRQRPAGNSEPRDFFRDMESNPKAKPSLHQLDSQQLDPRMKGFSLGWQNCAVHTEMGHISDGTRLEPADPRALGGQMAAGLTDCGSASELQFPWVPAERVVLLTRASAAQLSAREPGAPAPLPSWPRKPSCAMILVMAEHSCLWADDLVILH